MTAWAGQSGRESRESPLDDSGATPFSAASEFDRWLRDHRATEQELIAAIFKKASGKQTVTFDELLETAICHGWIDTQTRSIDDEHYAIRFVPRRPGSNWSPTNREIARRLVSKECMTAAGKAALPADL